MMSSETREIAPVKQLQVKDSTELATAYGVPQALMNMYWCEFAGTAYPKFPFLLAQAHKRGIQRLQVIVTEKGNDDYEAVANIYPLVSQSVLKSIMEFTTDPILRREMWDYYSAPTSDIGRGNKQTVKNPKMHPYLKEMAIKKAAARACRLYGGIGQTSYEELPDAELSESEIADARSLVQDPKHSTTVKHKTVADLTGGQPMIEAESAPAPSVEKPSTPDPQPSVAVADFCYCKHEVGAHFIATGGTAVRCVTCIKLGENSHGPCSISVEELKKAVKK